MSIISTYFSVEVDCLMVSMWKYCWIVLRCDFRIRCGGLVGF